ncbi:hypothetical protein ACF0H5_010881 [Mactra antiquata]
MSIRITSNIDIFDEEEEDTKQQNGELPDEPEVFTKTPEEEKPFVRFRRVARAVKLLIQVCEACRSLLEESISQESLYALQSNYAALASGEKARRAFVTYVPNDTTHELEQITFDLGEYMRHKTAEDYLTDEIRGILKQRPGTRTEDQIVEVVKCLKSICKPFNEYPLSIQKQIVQCSFYDKYRKKRVIIKKGFAPDGIYFVLSGGLGEDEAEGRKQPVEYTAGQKFGEEELICGSSRRATILTRNDVEILFLHRFDYRVIFNMSADSYNPKNLEICKNDAVFKHFPMQKLLDNPGTWSALKYKYGRLIVKDSNDIEWIYVIKSGEARVLKHLEPGKVDVKARRKKIQQQMEEQSTYHKKKKILDFIADGNGRKSCYAPSNYRPSSIRRSTIPTDPTSPHRNCHTELHHDPKIRSQSAMPGHVRAQSAYPSRRQITRPMTTDIPTRHLDNPDDTEDQKNDTDDKENKDVNIMVVIEETDVKSNASTDRSDKPSSEKSDSSLRSKSRRTSSRFEKEKDEREMSLPPFVQIETLHPGHTFGLRSCLEHDERGPSVSLVSGDCEVLAINKKFFMKHCDDALISLIRLKAKPFPSETELVDRLDANMQWEEFKQETLKDFLKHRVRVSR